MSNIILGTFQIDFTKDTRIREREKEEQIQLATERVLNDLRNRIWNPLKFEPSNNINDTDDLEAFEYMQEGNIGNYDHFDHGDEENQTNDIMQ